MSDKRAAIALFYDDKSVPELTAKGVGRVATEIIATAKEHNIPIEEDPELTTLLSQLDLGEKIPEELYLAVAEVLAFAYMTLGKFPQNWKPPTEEEETPTSDPAL
ncbi:MAG: EscU/YscU/HrcU family type III secretion system export apparatus switch protein [Gammaproteobacteria bacterium]|nr:EscU/YscU/HrcU family type III secretion system export apparatus switch protein [Gammaproteobacteria bacterium]